MLMMVDRDVTHEHDMIIVFGAAPLINGYTISQSQSAINGIKNGVMREPKSKTVLGIDRFRCETRESNKPQLSNSVEHTNLVSQQ